MQFTRSLTQPVTHSPTQLPDGLYSVIILNNRQLDEHDGLGTMVTAHPSAFGSLLRRYRIQAGLTQEELAERARLSARAVSDLERGARRSPYRETVELLANALELGDDERTAFRGAARRGADSAQSSDEEPSALQSPTNLPDDATLFIGREREIGQIAGSLQNPHIRLVTLTGPGGTGKTRLALQVGITLLHDFSDGVFFVNLGPLTDLDLVPSTVAGALGMKEETGKDLLESLIGHLKDRHLLLILDNYEHLLDASGVVSALLDGCRELHVLVTSRIPLHLAREREYAVPPLAVPDPMHLPDVKALSQYEAVALFIDRAMAVKADFQVTNENAPSVAEICARLDGLPLAIELAAARIKLFPPQALLQRLSSRLTLLTGGARDRPTRQQTLRNTLAWSYSLLSEDEQSLFAHLSVFAGGCTFEAAEGICDPRGDLDLLDGITSLVDKSLLRQEGEDEPRFIMLETVREYAQERLEEMGACEAVKAAHAQYYLAFAEEAAPELQGPQEGTWLDRLDAERDNLRAALQWAHDTGDLDSALRLAVALSGFWMTRGPLSEGRRWLDEVASAERGTPAFHADALFAAGRLASVEGRRRRAAELFERSLALYRELRNLDRSIPVLQWLAISLWLGGETQRSEQLLREAEIEGRETGNRLLLAVSLGLLAGLVQTDTETSRRRGDESLALYEDLGDRPGKISTLTTVARSAYRMGNRQKARALTDDLMALLRRSPVDPEWAGFLEILAYEARVQGDYAYATRFVEELMARAEAAGDRRGAAHARTALGLLLREQGDYHRATALYEESMKVFLDVGDLNGRCRTLVGMSDVARDTGDAERVIAFAEESLALLGEAEDASLTAYALHNLGLAAWYQGDHGQAEHLLTESLTLLVAQIGLAVGAEISVSIGLLALDGGQYDRAGGVFAECLVVVREQRQQWILPVLLEGVAGVAAGRGQVERAAQLLGAAERVRQSIGIVRWPALQSLQDRCVARTRDALGDERFLEYVEQGRAMTVEAAIAYALNEVARA